MIKGIIKHIGKNGFYVEPIQDTEEFFVYVKDVKEKDIKALKQYQMVEFEIDTSNSKATTLKNIKLIK